MNEELAMLVRYSAPHKYDHAPLGTKCKVITSSTTWEMYVQLSSQEDEPRWERLGEYDDIKEAP